DDVQAVEAGGQVEHRAVGAARDRGAVADQVVVLVPMPQYEEEAHQKRHHIPAPQAEHVAALSGEHAHLTGERRRDQHKRHRTAWYRFSSVGGGGQFGSAWALAVKYIANSPAKN